jgi:hypothetical protein
MADGIRAYAATIFAAWDGGEESYNVLRLKARNGALIVSGEAPSSFTPPTTEDAITEESSTADIIARIPRA